MPHEPNGWRDEADIPPRTAEERERYEISDSNPALHGDVPPRGYDPFAGVDADRMTRTMSQDDYGADGDLYDDQAERQRRPLPLINPAAWAGQTAPPREWAVTDWIPLRQATLLTGKGGVGKSLLAQMLATCTAAGLAFMGLRTRQTPALYVSCEDDADELWRRQAAICAGLGVTLESLDGKLFLAALAGEHGNAIATFDQAGRLHHTDRWREIENAVELHAIGFAALDNASHMMGGDHNDLIQVAAFLNMLNGLAIKANGALLILHHPNKAGDDWLGSVAWENQVRSRLILKPSDQEGDTDARSLHNPKANYSAMGARLDFRWHKGVFVRDGDLPASLTEEIASVTKANHDNEVFLRCLAERTRQQRAVSERVSSTYAPTVFATMPEAKGVSAKRLIAAMDRLFRINAIERGQLWKGADRKWVFGLRVKSAGDA